MKYPAIISKSHGSFLVEFPGLDGCYTEGNSVEDAIQNAKEALDGWLESNYERNLTVKTPVECQSIANIELKKKNILVYIPTGPVLSLAYQMRFSRLSEKLTLQNVAELMNLSQQNYSKTFENPKGNPSLKTLENAFEELGYFVELKIIPKSSVVDLKNHSIEKFKIGQYETGNERQKSKKRA